MLKKINDKCRQFFQSFTKGIYAYWETILATLVVIFLVSIVVVLVLHLVFGMQWADWTGLGQYVDADGKLQRGKTLWDWLELLIIPAVLAIGALLFNQQERKNETKIADQRNQENVLQNYLDKMNDLILDRHLLDVKRCREEATTKENPYPTEVEIERQLSSDLRAVLDLAHVRTVTVLRQLNIERKGIVVQFLRDANLAGFILVSASLNGVDMPENLWEFNLCQANLTDANLSRALLSRANLSLAFLIKADLSGAILNAANLHDANLNEANLCGANLFGANLHGAILDKANLSEANFHLTTLIGASFYKANLTGATFDEANLHGATVSEEQLSTVSSLERAIMPDGKIFNPTIHTFWKKKPEN